MAKRTEHVIAEKIVVLEGAAERSRRALPSAVSLLAIAILLEIAVPFVRRLPAWLHVVFLGVPALVVCGDLINVFWVSRRLKKENHDSNNREPGSA